LLTEAADRCVVLVSHRPTDAAAADEVVLLAGGRRVPAGTRPPG
jgi:ABC-type transport system involved in cytochrome bd biosynthesis fused ATPase/permease subunit